MEALLISLSARRSGLLVGSANGQQLFDPGRQRGSQGFSSSAANALRMLFFPGQHESLYMDSFETVITILGAVSCAFAVARCSRIGKEVWMVVTVYFAIMAIADFSRPLVDALPQIAAKFACFARISRLVCHSPLLLLAFFPIEEEHAHAGRGCRPELACRSRWYLGLAYFHFIYLPHAAFNLAWTSRGRPEDIRNMIVSAGAAATGCG